MLSIKGRVGSSVFADLSIAFVDVLGVRGNPADVGTLDVELETWIVDVKVVVVVVFDINWTDVRVADSRFSPLMLVNKLSESLVEVSIKFDEGLSVTGYTELGLETALGVLVVDIVVPSSFS